MKQFQLMQETLEHRFRLNPNVRRAANTGFKDAVARLQGDGELPEDFVCTVPYDPVDGWTPSSQAVGAQEKGK